jgi:hypothetical protein
LRLPKTALAAAFMRALIVWCARHPDTETTISIPSGTVTTTELRQVIVALLATKRTFSQNRRATGFAQGELQ